jgi:hypothetical protein
MYFFNKIRKRQILFSGNFQDLARCNRNVHRSRCQSVRAAGIRTPTRMLLSGFPGAEPGRPLMCSENWELGDRKCADGF